MRYLVASVTGSDRIGGRNESVDIPVGTVFTRVAKCRVDGDPMNLRTVDLGDVAEVRIRLLGVEHFGIRIDHVPADHSPTLFVDDASSLSELLNECDDAEYLTLIADDQTTP